MNVLLFGIKGCGKTTLGKQIAKKLRRAFIDTDSLLEKEFQALEKKNLSCRDIYQKVGPLKFRLLEREVVQSLQDVQHSVIAAGGGTMLSSENVEDLSKKSIMVYLFVDKEVLKKRVLLEDPLPPFLDPNNPEASFDKMYEERHAFYKKFSAKELDITHLDPSKIVNKVISFLDQKG